MSDDPYLKPAYGPRDRLRRLGWAIACACLYRPTPRPMFAWRAFVLRCFGAKIEHPSFFYPKAVIWAPWLLRAGRVVTVADGVELYNPGGIELKHHAVISQGSFICGATHDFNSPAFLMVSHRMVIESYAWVCARAIVLPGVVVGEGAVLGAGAVAGKNLEAWSVYAGNPARKVGDRNRFLDTDPLPPPDNRMPT